MLNEIIEYLNIKPGCKIIDATLNGGGHSSGILEKYPDTQILGIEYDPDIFREFTSTDTARRIKAVNDSYVNLKNIVAENDFRPDGIVFDLGMSSWHLELSKRGFSFRKNELLDMRFNPETEKITAAEMVNNLSAEDLERILIEYGEEQFAKNIAKEIVSARKIKAITETGELVGAIEKAVPGWYRHRKIHYATKTFQALRIAVNDELGNVDKGVRAAIDILNSGGRLAVISFQGLEDKIVKEIFKEKSAEGTIRWVIKGTIKPKWDEVKENPRARSAKLKVIEKI
jgi:16S rRNA (cytosine1402-N4)-methyltransferase